MKASQKDHLFSFALLLPSHLLLKGAVGESAVLEKGRLGARIPGFSPQSREGSIA